MSSLVAEGRLADHEVQVGVLVDAELDLAALDLGDRLGDVHRDGAGLRVGHQATRAQHLAQPADLAHEVGGRHRGVEVGPACGDLLDQLVATDLVGAGGPGLLSLVTVGEHHDAGGLAGAVREVDRAADHLVGLARVDAEAQGDLDGRVELRRVASPSPGGPPRAGCTGRRGRSARRPWRRPCCASCAVSSAVEFVVGGPALALPRVLGRAVRLCGAADVLAGLVIGDAHGAGGAGDDLHRRPRCRWR